MKQAKIFFIYDLTALVLTYITFNFEFKYFSNKIQILESKLVQFSEWYIQGNDATETGRAPPK